MATFESLETVIYLPDITQKGLGMTGIGKLQRSGKGKTIEDAKKDMSKQKFTGDCKGYVPVAAYIETWQNSGPFGQLLEQQVF